MRIEREGVENAAYKVLVKDITLRTDNSTGFKENGLVANPEVGETPISLSKIELTRVGDDGESAVLN